jgi:hypothetical protein
VQQLDGGGEKTGKNICSIFHDGIPRLVDIPSSNFNDVFDQLKADYARICKTAAFDLSLVTDPGLTNVVGKRSMSDANGKSIYKFIMSVSPPDKEYVNIDVSAEEDLIVGTDQSTSAANTAFQRQVRKKAEKEDNKAKMAKGGHLIEYGDYDEDDDVDYAEPSHTEDPDVASYMQGKVRIKGVRSADPQDPRIESEPAVALERPPWPSRPMGPRVPGPMPVQASQCPGENSWLNPATGKTGACLSTTGSFAWHCPWESVGLVSGSGCTAVKYDCGDAGTINTLLAYYRRPPKKWGPARTAYTVSCIKSQCQGGAPPGPSQWHTRTPRMPRWSLEEKEAKDEKDEEDSEFDQLLVDGQAPTTFNNIIGKLRVLDDRTSPPLCCLCGKCSNPKVCEGDGEESTNNVKLVEDDDEDAKIAEQKRLYPELAPNLLLQIGTATVGSKEELEAPPIPGDVLTKSSFRVRAEPGYGDNFHSLILPARTAEDHRQVWAQSRALIEEANAEGITVPASYHFYDTVTTARCFQPAYQQGECGSCWSFASLGALEKQICMRSEGDVKASLSREMLVRCSEQNNGCEGGNADKAYEDLMEIGGVFSTDCLPYQGKGSKHCPVFAYSWFGQGSKGKTGKFARIDQEIQKSCVDHTRYSNRPPQGREWDMPFRMMYERRFGTLPNLQDQRLARFRKNFAKTRARDRVPSWWLYGQEAMKTAITKYGSVYGSFKVRDDFKGRQCADGCWPPGTVYGEEAAFHPATCGCGKGHAIHIIGFGEDIQETGKKVPYWLIENSWGQEHGNVFGQDIAGAKGFGPDPFTEEHPMGIEDKCLLAGWAYSALPKTGGCGGNANVAIRSDVDMKGGQPDGMVLSVMVDDVGKGNWSIPADSTQKFALNLDLTPGPHKVKFMVYAKNHPKQQAFDVEDYGIMATSLRCRGRGYRYSFTQNDTKASLSWGRKTRTELKAEADALIPTSTDPKYLYGNCSEPCRTGRYSWVKPCLGVLTKWGSCYTQSWARTSNYVMSKKIADCAPCAENEVKAAEKEFAVRALDNATFSKWFRLVEQSWDAPDDAGWMRMKTGSCKIKGGGFVKNALLSATYDIDMPGNKFCDERHSAPYAKGKFVSAPGYMADGKKTTQRCPPPMLGKVDLECRNGALYALSNSCALRAGTPDSMLNSTGYYKMLRGTNYHGIESGAAFAVAEMNRFTSRCPTLSWSKWSECNVTIPCAHGVQTRSRAPINLPKTDPRCAQLLFHEERSCVGPGFCPQVLTRFVAKGSLDIASFTAAYKIQSTTVDDNSYATAGVTMLNTSSPSCSDAKYWCRITTGVEECDMYMEGHFKVHKTAEYYLHYETESGGGEIEFNTLGAGKETKPQFRIKGGPTSEMFEWQDLGFHHRRRRSASKPWVRISTLKLDKGTYYARMTRGDWSSCPTYTLRLEQLSARYRPPILLGVRGSAAALTKGERGGSKQKTTTWWNNWGPARYAQYRGRGSSGPKSEDGSMNEMVLRRDGVWKVIKKVPITKFNFTADELYKMLDVNRFNLPDGVNENYAQPELVIRNTVILPEEGEYVFKFQIDTSYTDAIQAWHQSSRRRSTRFHIRAGANPSTGTGGKLATFSSYVGSATKSVSFTASEAGTVPVEVAIKLWYNAPGNKMVLPNSIRMEVKRKDLLHGESLPIGSNTKYMSDLEAVRGDTQVRIDWPDRDDPLSSELKTQTFQELPPQALLIGNKNLLGFRALAEAKIDAGACMSLEAWASGVDKSSHDVKEFWGVGLNLCDVDGSNQYLELVTYHPPDAQVKNLTNYTTNRVGWVHASFTQPMHMRIVRDPLNLGKFEFGYRPDNRAHFATPFTAFSSGFTGKMEVGVSMNSAEAYRYAEFYNVSIEDCPASCKDAAGAQLFCGEMTTPCGNKLNCAANCSGGDVCHNEMCMKCPSLKLTANQSSWECGHIEQHCENHKKQKIQVRRDIGTMSRPTLLHFCKDNKWYCRGKSKWSFLTEGKDCGTVTDSCNNDVQLFNCPMDNDVCENHKCKCTPTIFDQSYNCGTRADGCGRVLVFGQHNGSCAGATDRCLSGEYKCCTPKTTKDFPAAYQCGSESDGCGKHAHFNQTPATSFFKAQPNTNANHYSDYTGHLGIEITAHTNGTIMSLARPLSRGLSALSTTSRVTVWDVHSQKELGHVDVGPSASVHDGFAWVGLSPAVSIKSGKKYRIVYKVSHGSKDKYPRSYKSGPTLTNTFNGQFASLNGMIRTPSDGYPNANPGRGYGSGLVNFDIVENDGCGSGAWTCHSNHTCTKRVITGFTVKSGPCVATGKCVTSPNFPSKYNNRESCTILTPSDGKMKVEELQTESGYDYLTIDNRRVQGRLSSEQQHNRAGPWTLTAQKTFYWRSDSSVTRKGWKICMDDGASLNQEEDEEEQHDESSEQAAPELTESELAELSDEERQHAVDKYEAQRKEEKAEREAAVAAEEEMAEMQKEAEASAKEVKEPEAEAADEEEENDVELDADELALPDLTKEVAEDSV